VSVVTQANVSLQSAVLTIVYETKIQRCIISYKILLTVNTRTISWTYGYK